MTPLRTRVEAVVSTSVSTASALSRWTRCKLAMLGCGWSEAVRKISVTSQRLRARARPQRSHKTRSLLRKYAALLVALVGGSLIVNASIEMYYSYGESREALIAVQREKALGAAAVIEQFVKEIEGQVGWATGFLPAGSGLEQRRFDFLRLLRQAPAITEVSYLDADGREQIKVSRLAMDTLASGADLSQEPKFAHARANKRYFSPVYFRKESEPYLTLAIAGSGRSSGVTVAEVNLKFIWDVISRIHVRESWRGLRRGRTRFAHRAPGHRHRAAQDRSRPASSRCFGAETSCATRVSKFRRHRTTAWAAKFSRHLHRSVLSDG